MGYWDVGWIISRALGVFPEARVGRGRGGTVPDDIDQFAQYVR
jgi:hypothetical protein